jgi:molybdopterin-binding protein
VRYRIGQAAALLGVSADTVRRLVDDGELDVTRSPGGHRLVDGPSLATYAAAHAGEHAHEHTAQSARNRFAGIVTRVVKDTVTAQVELQAGPFRVVSLMTREAADELGLAPGVAAVAVVKATNVVVDLPERPPPRGA